MADPRLNSVHLEPTRREAFRHARDLLLQARGDLTVSVERHHEHLDPQRSTPEIASHTHIEAPGQTAPLTADFCLIDRDTVYPLQVGINTLGRSSENNVVVPDAFVSRRHCAILVHHTSVCEIYDTASKNGTFLNGHKIAGATRLHTGDEIRVCDAHYVFISKHDAPQASIQTQTVQE